MINSHINNLVLTTQVCNSLTVDIFKALENAYAKKEANHIVPDLLQCNQVDSGGLSMLLQMRERMDKDSETITLKNLSPELMKIFEVVKSQNIFRLI